MNVGIDLGTTYSLIARMDAEGRPALLPDYTDPEVVHTPSVVHLAPGAAYVGLLAEALLEQDPQIAVIRYFKRLMGEQQPVHYDDQGRPWYPEGVSALLLKKLRHDAETSTAADVEGAVITVPAHFTDPQRKAVLAAAALADLSVIGLVEEPVAAALHYGVLNQVHDRIMLVYDFGGGTFDATALSMDASGVYVLAKTGITELGGKELDEVIGQMILAQFEVALGAPLPMGARTLLDLRRVSEEIKIELCLPTRRNVRRLVMLGGQAVEVELSRTEFDSAIREMVDRTEAELRTCVRDAGLRLEDVNSVLLVGGSSMVPLVETRIRELFAQPGQEVLFHEPSKAIAYGAAVHAAQLTGSADVFQIPPELRGVTGYGVGVRAVDPVTGRVTVDTLIKKNMPLPARARKTYYTSRPEQVRIVLDFVQFRDPKEQLVSLGRLVVGPLASPRANYPIEVSTEYREDGTVAVQAYDAQSGVELEHVFGRDLEGGSTLPFQKSLIRGTVINNVITA
ncbi:MAG TPA: Hsp70 family protein [Vicinamibacteria bacterium]|nr:Hsp70 family protein [Vicinamibacteria bacterium]